MCHDVGHVPAVRIGKNPGKQKTWNRHYQRCDPEDLKQHCRLEDGDGRYQTISLTGAGIPTGGQLWSVFDPTAVGRHWAVPRQSLETAYPDRADLNSLSTEERFQGIATGSYLRYDTDSTDGHRLFHIRSISR